MPDAEPRPKQPSIVRAVLTGMLIGSTLSICNIYSGLKIGWSANMSVTGALLAYAVWRVRPRSLAERSPFGILETNLAQTAASSAAAVSSAGLVAGIPALTIATGIELSWPQLALWVLGVCFTGIMLAVPLRRQMIVAEPLPFPQGIATAETLKQIYAHGQEAIARVTALLVTAVVSGALKALEFFKVVGSMALPGALRGYSLKNLTFALDPSLLLVGIGGLMGPRASVSVLLGSVLAYGVVGPALLDAGVVTAGPPDKPWFKQLVEWLLWPGVTLMVVASLTSLALSWRSLARGLAGLRGVAASGEAPGGSDEVPGRWLLRGVLGAVALITVLQVWFFAIPWWAALTGVAMSAVLAVVAARVTGETGVTPIGAMGKVTQLMMGAALPGNVAANLMTANVTGGAASQCADLMNDLKTGQILGASPKSQWIAQLFGAIAGALFGSAVYLVLVPDPANQLMTTQWPAPAVITWKTVAEVFRVGISALPSGTPLAMGVAAGLAVALAVAEAKAPASIKRWVPSPAALGMTFVVPANQGLALFIGGMLSIGVNRLAPQWHTRFWVVICAGAIAGEGIVGAVLSVYAMLRG